MATFPAPKDFEIPEGTQEGDTFEAMATLRLDAGGRLTLVSLEGCECEDDMGEGEGESDGESEGEGPEGAPSHGKSFVNQVEIKFGSAGLD